MGLRDLLGNGRGFFLRLSRLSSRARVLFLLAALAPPTSALSADRAAVVIANAAYARPLPTAAADGRLIGNLLRELGFNVLLVQDARSTDWPAVASAITKHTQGAKLAMIYFNGHALGLKGENQLLPVDVANGSEDELQARSLGLGRLAAAIDPAVGTSVLILDAVPSAPVTVAGGKGEGGFAALRQTSDRQLVAFAAQPGEVYRRTESAGNGVYAIALANALTVPGTKLLGSFRDLRRAVREATQGLQLPVLQGGRVEDVVLRPPAPVEDAPGALVPPLDQVLWRFVRDSADETDLEEFAAVFPNSPLSERALARRVRLASASEPGVGTLTRALIGRNLQLAEADTKTGDYTVASTIDRSPPVPLRTWPRDLPLVPDGGLRQLTTRCDDVAADPDDPQRIAPGINWLLINRRAAARACITDLLKDPENRRLQFQVGRVLDIAGFHAWAETFYRSAAEKTYGAALINIGYMHLTGRGRPTNFPEAVRYMRLAADLGNYRARTDLGQSYLDGRGVEQSIPEAILWLRLAGSSGWPNAIDILGNLYSSGRGVEKNDTLAAELFQTSAWVGNTNAMVNLARAYLEGRGVKQDAGIAITWFERSNASGNPFAPFWLGLIHAGGWGVKKDPSRAAAFFALSANRGFGQARYELAKLYETGGGVRPDIAEAAFNYALTDRTSYETPVAADVIAAARAKTEELRRRLTPAQREAVDKRVEEWIRLNGS